MPRTYVKRRRATSALQTRDRIIEAALVLLPEASDIGVDRIAEAADVSVQTIYTHFGSKRGLLIATIDAAQRDAGLYVDLDRVWSSPDGETALRRMADATIRLWHGAWPFVAFSERARRVDSEIEAHMTEVDGYRRHNLRSITDQLAEERRLRDGLGAARATDLVFAMTLPSVYDTLVRARGWSIDDAAAEIAENVARAVIKPGSSPVTNPPADWSAVLRPPLVEG